MTAPAYGIGNVRQRTRGVRAPGAPGNGGGNGGNGPTPVSWVLTGWQAPSLAEVTCDVDVTFSDGSQANHTFGPGAIEPDTYPASVTLDEPAVALSATLGINWGGPNYLSNLILQNVSGSLAPR
jgi:hypothetical protein